MIVVALASAILGVVFIAYGLASLAEHRAATRRHLDALYPGIVAAIEGRRA